MISQPRRILFYTLAGCIPIILIVAAEVLFRLLGVGESTRTPFIKLQENADYAVFNPAYAERYFQGFTPSVAYNPFSAQKPENSYRIVVLGGSSTAGFPYHFYYGFPESVGRRAQAYMTERRIEIINLGMTAVNSYTLWDLKKRVRDIQPDVVLIYAGHNEYYGAFGAGSNIGLSTQSIFLKRLLLKLKRTAIFTSLEQLIQPRPELLPGESDGEQTLMARVVREAVIQEGDDVFLAGIKQFETNMRDVVTEFSDAGIPVIIGTLTSNTQDQAPLGKLDEAQTLFETAQSMSCEYRGCSRESFIRAKDLDEIRFRAPSEINSIIRSMTSDGEAILVDVEQLFENESLTGVPGSDLFIDHLHPNQKGLELMGAAFASAILEHENIKAEPTAWPTEMKLDPLAASHANLLVERLLMDYPFIQGRSPDVTARLSDSLVAKFKSGKQTDSLSATIVTSPLTVSEALFEAIQSSEITPQERAQMYEALFYWRPLAIDYMKQTVAQQVTEPLLDSLTTRLAVYGANKTNDVYFWNVLGAVFLRQNHFQEADRSLAKAEAIDSTSTAMLFNRAKYYLTVGDTLTAQSYFSRYQEKSTQN